MQSSFIWDEALGKGYYPVDGTDAVYDKAYFDKYVGYESTKIGEDINKFRTSFVNSFVGEGAVVDIGIGSGFFVKNRKNTYGYDVNPVGVKTLQDMNLFLDVYTGLPVTIKAVTCFDSLEHIKSPERLFNVIPKGTFLITSIPIFRNKEHCLSSKHFRPDEHYHYFTHMGFINYMQTCGFAPCWMSNVETELGRDEIYTYSFIKQ